MLDALPHKLQISLHSREGNNTDNPQQYIDEVITFAQEAARRGCIVVLRLWNEGDHNQMNDSILRMIAGYQPQPWTSRNDGWKLADNLLIENDNMFDWSDLQQKSYGDEEVLDFILRFLAMAELKRAFILLIWLNENDEKQRGPLPSNWTVFRQVFDGFPSFSRSSFVLLSFEIRSILVRFSIGPR